MEKWISKIFLGFSLILHCIASATEPRLLPTHSSSIQTLLQEKKWAQVVELSQPLIQENPYSLDILVDLSIALTHLGKRTEALILLHRATQEGHRNKKKFLIRRRNILARLFLTQSTLQTYQTGLSLMAKRQYDLANEKFSKALKEEPDNTEILVRYGQSLLLSHNAQAAIGKFKSALSFYPFPVEVKLWLGRALFENNRGSYLTDHSADLGLTELTWAFNELRESQLAPLWLAEALFLHGQTSNAIQLLDLDYKKYPTHLLSLIQSGFFRLNNTHADTQALTFIKNELQRKIKQLSLYVVPSLDPSNLGDASDLIVEVGQPRDAVKEDMRTLQQKIEGKLQRPTLKFNSLAEPAESLSDL